MSKKPTLIKERFLSGLLEYEIRKEFEASHSYSQDLTIKPVVERGYYYLSIAIADFIASGQWVEIECLGGAIIAKLSEFQVKMVIPIIGKELKQESCLSERDFSCVIRWNAEGKIIESDFDDFDEFDFDQDFEDFMKVTEKPESLRTIKKPKAVVKPKPKKPTPKS